MLKICQFEDEFEEQVIGLIVGIQRREFDIDITADDQPDLSSIPGYYQTGKGNFWVALDGEKVVGTIALLDIGAGDAALRKMFVAPDYRGGNRGAAGLLLDALRKWAGAYGVNAIYLGTTSKFLAAHRFYEKNGFFLVDRADLPDSFPVMAVDSRFYKSVVGKSED